MTPVDDDLDEANETIDVTGTLSSVTITGATVTFTDNDDPVSFSIADAEATEGGKVAFTVRRAGAGDNVASVKVTTATDSGDGANAADADDYTAIATAQTVNFAKGVTSQTVEVQTTQDDLFEPDETFLAVLSAPALADGDPGTGISIETDKGTATGTIKNDDVEPSFAVVDASATEGNGITFTVTRSGAMDNAVSVKWNTKPDSGAGAASATDYTPVTAATVLNFASGASSQTFTVATTEDVLAEGDETFLVELTGAVGGTIATAEATGTITDDDAAPTGITLSVDADTATNNVQSSIAEEGGVKTVRVTATINGATRFAAAQTVTVTVGKDGDSATEGTDYSNVAAQSIEIPIGAASAYVDFPLTPTTDVLSEGSETISVEGTLTDVTFTNTAITITDDDAAPGAITLSVDADTGTNNVQSSIAEEGGVKTVRVTATINGTTRFATAQTVTVTVGKDGDSATEGTDYATVDQQSIEIPIGAASAYVEFMLTPTTDVLFEGSETISVDGTLTGVTFTNSSITITDDDAAPSAITLSVDTNAGGDGTPTTLAEGAAATTVRVIATITSATRFATEQTVKVKVGKDGDSAAEGTDYALVADQNINIPAGATSAYVDFSLAPTQDVLDETNETISVDGELTGVTFTPATITINDDDAAPEFITLAVDTNAGGNGTPTSVGEEAGATTVRVTATITSATRFEANQAVTFEVGKSADSATEGTDYTEVGTLTITIDGGDASGYVDFTLMPASDVLDELNETISVHGTQANITFTDATITITDDDAAPTGITLSVDTNGSTSGTPSTVAEDAGATVVTVTATVNGTTRYVDAKTVVVSVADGTAASPADYAAVSGFNITIAAGAASHTGSFTVTPVDDDLDEADETIDVTGTLTDITITPATVTLADTDAPVSFSIADAEATEGGKVTFTVSRAGAEDNVAEVKIATTADSGDGVKAAGTDDYTAISPAQTLNFAAGTTSQTVEVQTTQDDLFEPDETFRAVLSAPALGDGDPGTGVSIESGKGTAIGTIKNDDTQPSFAVADASASEGDAITFTVTRSGAMDNVVSVKWNTSSDSGAEANAAFPSDYTPVTTARTLTFAKGVSSQTFTVATTEDVLDEDDETFLVELTGAVGATIATAQATGTITDDDAAPSGITLTVSPATVGEGDGETEITVTATVNGTTRYVDAKTVTVSVGGGTATSDTDYDAVANFDITIAAGAASHTGTFDLTPTDDDLHEGSETIDVTGVSGTLTITKASITLEDDDVQPSFAVADANASEGDAITFTVTRSGAMDNAVSVKWNTKADSSDGANAASASDYTPVTTAMTLSFAKGEGTQTFTVATTEDTLNEADETFLIELTEPVGATITDAEATGTITNDDAAPTTLTLAVDADNNAENVQSSLAENGGAKTVKVTATLGGSTQFDVDKTLTLIVGDDDDSATEGTDYTTVDDVTLTIPAGDQDVEHTFTLTPTDDAFNEASETISFDATLASVIVTGASITLTSDDAAPAITLTVDADKDTDNVQTSLAEDGGVKTVRVTATLDGTTRLEAAADLTLAVGKDGDSAVEGTDYTNVADRTITIGAGVASVTDDFTLTPTNDDLYEGSETISLDGTLTGVTVTDTSLTLTDDDAQPSFAVADASAAEGDAITFTVTRSGAMDNAVSVKWNTKAATGAGAASTTDYTAMTTATKLDFAKGVGSQTFTVATTEDTLHEGNETFLVELTEPVGAIISDAEATGTINDDDAAPTGITLTVDTNGSTSGTPSTVAEDAGATVVTVTATVNGTTRYVDAKTVAVSVADDTAASPADYAAVSGFNITIAAGAASQTGSFTVTPVDDDLDEANETIDVTGTLTDITITGAMVTFTDNDDPVSFSIADAEATEGGKVTFTVSRGGAEDNVASVKVTTVADSGDGVNAADADDYTAISSAQTLNFAKGVTSQTVEVQTTQDDLFEPDETFRAVLSAPALGEDDPGTGVSIETGKGTAIGTIKNDDTEPSFAVADASASEGDTITFTVTRSGAMDNAVSVKWNTKAATGAGAAATTDYTAMTTATKLDFAKGVETQTFTVATTEDTLHEGNETFLVELTEPVGAIIGDAEAIGTINDDDPVPSTLAISVDADTSTDGTQTTIAEDGGVKTVRVTATLGGNSTFTEAKTVTVEVGADADSATEGTDYANVGTQSITINAGSSSGYVDFPLTPMQDTLHEGSETISLDGTLTGVTVTDATITLTDDDGAPTALTLSVDADTNTNGVQTSLAEGGGAKTVRVTATLSGSSTFTEAKTVTVEVGADADSATEGTDYTNVGTQSITINAGASSGYVEFTLTPIDDTRHETSETISFEGALDGVTVINVSLSLTDNDAAPTTLTLAVDADDDAENVQSSLAENGGAKTVKVTATLGGSTQFDEDKTLTLIVGDDDDSATEGTDYTNVADVTLTIPAGDQDVEHTFMLTPTDDAFNEANETISFDATLASVIVTGASITLTSDDAAPAITLTVDADKDTDNVQTSLAEDGGVKTVRVTATLDGTTRLEEAADLTLAVGKDGDSAVEGTDYTTVGDRTITIGAGVASVTHDFTLTPMQDVLHEGSETISLDGTLTGVTVTDATITLTDDDAAPGGITLTVSPATVGEGAGETEITVTATVNGSTRYVDAKTVTVSVGGGTAISGTDYDAVSNFDIIIAAGDASKAGTFDLTPTDDDLHEGSETIDVTGTSGALTITKAEISLTDDDGQPSFAVADASADEGDTITFTVTRSGAMDNAVSVKWNTKAATGAGAAATTDYTAMTTATKLDFASGASSQTFTVATTEDTLHEGDETFLVELTEPVGAIIGDAEATGTITDDDAVPTALTLSVDADTGTMGTQTSLAEDGGAKMVRVTATLGGSSTFTEAKTVTVEVGPDADGATEGTDYTEVTSKSITIDAGSLSGYVDFTLTPTDDDIDEPSEGISIEGTLTGVTVTGTSITLTDDEGTPTVTLVLTPGTINESGNGNASTVTATLSGKSSVEVTLTVAAAAGADTVASDFTVTTNKTLTIAAGVTTSAGTVTITAVDNDVDAPNKSVTVSAVASGGGVANPDNQTLTINDDEGVPTATLVLTPASISESGATNSSTVKATLSGKSNAAVTLTVATAAGANTAAADFTLSATTTLTIAAGATTSAGAVTITAVDNDVDAPNKSVTVSATASGGGVANPADQTLTITDDEGTPTVTLVLTPTTIDESGDDNASTVTAMLSGESSAAVTVTVSVPNDAPVTLSNNAALSIAAGTTASTGAVTITAVDNDIDAPNKTVTVSATASGRDVANPTSQTLTITDDDAAPSGITLSVSPTAVGEEDSETEITVTATVNGTTRYADAKTVTVSVGGGTAISGTDYDAVANFDITIAASDASKAGTFDLTPINDVLSEANETINVAGTSGSLTITPTTVTITDDDAAPGAITISVDADTGTDGTQTTIAENGGAKTVRVTATITGETRFVEAKTVTLEVGADADSATEGTDYREVTSKSIPINAGAASGYVEFTLTPTDDTRHEASETISLDGSLAGLTVSDGSLSITDNDAAPTTLTLTVDADDGTDNVQSSLAENGGAKTVRVTATLGGSTQFDEDKDLTLIVGKNTDSATEGTDYTDVADVTLTIPAGDQDVEHTFTLTPTDDTFHEASETISFDATVAGLTVAGASISLTSDDAAAAVTLTVDTNSTMQGDQDTLAENAGATSVTVTATLSGATRFDKSTDLTLIVGDADADSATEGTDYTDVADQTINFVANAQSASHTFTITPTDDAFHEANETISLEGALAGVTVSGDTITLTSEDAAPAITLTVDADKDTDNVQTSLAEDGGGKTVRVTATLDGTTRLEEAADLTLAVGKDGDSAVEGADYTTVADRTITIGAGVASVTHDFTLTPTNDVLHEGAETISLDGTLTGVTVTDTSLTLTDDDATPSGITLTVSPTTVGEGAGETEITVTATVNGTTRYVDAKTVTVSVGGGTATSDTDYDAVANFDITIAAGDASKAGTFDLTPTEDDLHEGSETIDVTGTSGALTITKAEISLTDDDGQPSFAVADASADEGDTITFTVTRSGAMDNAVSVKWNTKAATGVGAAATTDYTAMTTATKLDFASGASSQTFTVATTEDTLHEGDETFLVELTEPVGGIISDAEATGTITDDDAAPTALTLSVDADTGTMGTQTSLAEDGGAKMVRVTATLGGSSTFAEAKMVTVEVGPDADGATEGTDYTEVTSKSITIDAGSLSGYVDFTLTPADDDIDEPSEGISIEGTLTGVTVTGTSITLTDDEGTPTVTLVLTPGTINESGNGNASTVTATLSGESSAAVTVEVSVPNDAPVTLSANKTLTITAGSKASTGTVTITAVDNDVDAANASVVVSGAASGGGVTNPANQTLTITDDEGTPTVTLVLTPTTINESGATNASAVTAMLSGKSNTAVTLTVAAAAGANTVAGDFTVSNNKTLTIAAGATTSTGTVKITAVNNNVDAPNKSVTVSATASGGGVTNPDNQTLTITDDDAPPTGITLSVSPATLGEGDGLTQITVTAAVNGTTRYVDAKTVTVSVGGGTAISGTDYGAVSNFDITIAAGDASETGTFDLTPTDDALHEEDEMIEVTGTFGALTITPATVTIVDNDASGPAGTVSLSTSRYEVLEGDSLSVTVNLSEAPAADTMIELEATSPGGYSATPGADYVGGVQTVTIRAGTTSGKAHIPTTRDNQNDPNETFKLAIRASELPGTVTLGEPDTAVVTIRERVSGITPPETATAVYAGRKSRILMPVPAGLKGHGIDVAFYFDWGPGTAQGGGDCREPGTDVVDWGHWPSYPEGMVRTGPLVRIAEDINTDTIELEIELCKGSVGKTFTASWDSLQWLGNPDRGFPGVKSYPFNAAAAHCTSTALCYTRVTIIGDTPDPDPEITIAAGGDITEGGDAVFTVQASPAPASDLEIALAIADDAVSDFLTDGEEGSKTVTIAAGSDTATYTLATTDDDLDEANGGVSATLEAGTGYRVASPSTATVAVADNDGDDDARATVVRITGGADITEGGVARFTLTGAPAPSQDITVNLRVTQSGAFAGDGELGARPVTLGTDATVTVDIPTVDDSTLEDDGSLTITVEPGTGYTPHATDASATVAVADDEVPSLPTIHIDDVEAAEGDDLHFTFTLSHAVDHEVVVYWETRFGANYHDDENGHGPSYGEAIPHADFRYADSRVTVYPGSTRGEFWVETGAWRRLARRVSRARLPGRRSALALGGRVLRPLWRRALMPGVMMCPGRSLKA